MGKQCYPKRRVEGGGRGSSEGLGLGGGVGGALAAFSFISTLLRRAFWDGKAHTHTYTHTRTQSALEVRHPYRVGVGGWGHTR